MTMSQKRAVKARKARAVKAAKVAKPSKVGARKKVLAKPLRAELPAVETKSGKTKIITTRTAAKSERASVSKTVAPAMTTSVQMPFATVVAEGAHSLLEGAIAPSAQPEVQDFIELFPSGIAIASEMGRPILILKDKSGDNVMPVWMHPLDAGVALAGLQDSTGLSPHIASKKILSAVGLKVDTCTFVELVGHHQYVQVQLRPAGESPRETGVSFKVRADEVMSFCIQAGARFFSTKDMMTRCLRVNADMGTIEQGFAKGHLSALQNEMEISSKKFPYVM